jgi:hypothetical protein
MLYLSKKNVAKVYRILYIFKFLPRITRISTNFFVLICVIRGKLLNTIIPKSEIHIPKSQ